MGKAKSKYRVVRGSTLMAVLFAGSPDQAVEMYLKVLRNAGQKPRPEDYHAVSA